jgi:hypothetical protein
LIAEESKSRESFDAVTLGQFNLLSGDEVNAMLVGFVVNFLQLVED